MHFINVRLRFLRDLSYRRRVGVLSLCFLACLLLFLWSFFFFTRDASLFALPVALAAWMFKRRETLVIVGCIIVAVALLNSIMLGSVAWPRNLVVSFFFGSLVFIAEALFISYLREMLDVMEETRRKSQEAEALTAEANKQQQRLNRMKDQLLLNVSHEMRTPLTELQGYLELLQVFQGQLDEGTYTTFVNNAISGCSDLEMMLSNVLEAVNAGNITPRLEKLSIAQVVHDVLQQFDPRKQEAFVIRAEIPENLIVMADQQHVRRVIRNLLSNAFKYSPAHSLIVISSSSYPDANGCTYVCTGVKDTGPGIPPAESEQLFEKFSRLERDLFGTTRGTGLGLYISKQLVESMGGRIWVESSGVPGEGSAFCFTLPLVPSQVQPSNGGLLTSETKNRFPLTKSALRVL